MWTMVTYIYENIEFPEVRDFPFLVITTLLSKVVGGSWSIEDCIQALNVISELSRIFNFINSHNKQICVNVVHTLSNYIENSMVEDKKQVFPEALIIKSFYAILDWIMCDTKDQWLISTPTSMKEILRVCEICITGNRYSPQPIPTDSLKDPNKRKTLSVPKLDISGALGQKASPVPYYIPPTDKIKNAASFVFMNILNRLDTFPMYGVGPHSVSSLRNEIDILEANQLSPSQISCFVYNHTLISLIRHHRKGNALKVSIIMRDDSGRYAWDAELNYNASIPAIPSDEDKISEPEEKNLEVEEDEGLLSSLEEPLNAEDKKQYNKIYNFASSLLSKEVELLKLNGYGRNVDCSVSRTLPPDFFDDNEDFTPTRLLVNHLGIGNLMNYENFLAVQKFNSPESKFNYTQNFNLIDKNKERETYQVGIIYVGKGQNLSEIFENQSGSSSYHDFLQNVGWIVNLNGEHCGFVGGLDAKVTGSQSPYWANYDVEMIFQVATLMPNKEPATKQIHKTRLINNNKVLISWVEDSDCFKCPDSQIVFHIIIHPLPSELYQIKIESSQVSSVVGPLLDNMIVSKHTLPTLIRYTALNASKLLKEDHTKPYIYRRFFIEDFIQRHRVEQPVHAYLASQLVG